MNTDLIKEYAKLQIEKNEAAERTKAIGARMTEIADQVRGELVDNEVQNVPVTVKGQRMSVHLKRLVWAKPAEGITRDEVGDVLKHCGLSWMVKENWNANSLSGYVRERLAAGQTLQPTLSAVLEVGEKVDVVASKVTVSESKSAAASRTLHKKGA